MAELHKDGIESSDSFTYSECTADSGEKITLRTDPSAFRSVGAGNFSAGEKVQLGGVEIEILGVASMFTNQSAQSDFTFPGGRNNPNNMLWVKTNGTSVGYFRLKNGETYDSVFKD